MPEETDLRILRAVDELQQLTKTATLRPASLSPEILQNLVEQLTTAQAQLDAMLKHNQTLHPETKTVADWALELSQIAIDSAKSILNRRGPVAKFAVPSDERKQQVRKKGLGQR